MDPADDARPLTPGPVVSSAHLASSGMPELSEMEFALTMANHAFQRWMSRCMTAAGMPGLAPLEVLELLGPVPLSAIVDLCSI